MTSRLEEKRVRLGAANEIIKCFTGLETKLILRGDGRVAVSWKSWQKPGKTVQMTWMCRGQDFFPSWYRKAGWGGTVSTAVSQLVRWVQGKPVYGLETWKYWGSDGMGLFNCGGNRRDPVEVLELIRKSGWPEHPVCILCKRTPPKGLDWWSLDGKSGPCCSFGRCTDDNKVDTERDRRSITNIPT